MLATAIPRKGEYIELCGDNLLLTGLPSKDKCMVFMVERIHWEVEDKVITPIITIQEVYETHFPKY